MSYIKSIHRLTRAISDRPLFALLFLGFVSRIALSLVLGTDQYGYENEAIAMNLVNGLGFVYSAFPPATSLQETCFMAPFYPFFMAGIYSLVGTTPFAVLVIQLIQSVVGTATIIPVFKLTVKVFSRRTAILSAIAIALYPGFVYSASIVHKLVFSTFFASLIVYQFWILGYSPEIKAAMLTGCICGVALLVEPALISVIGLMLLWLTLRFLKRCGKLSIGINSGRSRREKIIILFIVIAGCCMVIGPWELRCLAVQGGRPIFLKDSGFNLWRGNNPNYTATGEPPWCTSEQVLGFNTTDEGEIDSAFAELAFQYIQGHILETLKNAFAKMLNLWWFPSVLPEQSSLIRQVVYAPFIIIAIPIVIVEKRKHAVLFLILPLLAFSLFYSVAFVLPRYRVPVQIFLFVLSCRGLDLVIKRIQGQREDPLLHERSE